MKSQFGSYSPSAHKCFVYLLARSCTLGMIIVTGLSLMSALARSEPQATGLHETRSQPEGHAARPALPKPPGSKALVPFTMLPTNHMLVRAQINDKGPYFLIFDLGAPITLLSNRASEVTGVVKANAPRSFLFGMRGEADVNKLNVG